MLYLVPFSSYQNLPTDNEVDGDESESTLSSECNSIASVIKVIASRKLGALDVSLIVSTGENKRKPQLTSIIAASSGAMKADGFAKKALNGIKSGSFFVSCNFEGFLLSIATTGISPQRSYLMAIIGDGEKEYMDDDLDQIRKEWAQYVSNFIFRS